MLRTKETFSENYINGLVSVIIPSYQSKWCVCEAINSVLCQTYRKFEVIVVDDGSTDGTSDYLKIEYGNLIEVIEKENGGLANARNVGISFSTGEFINFLDADDLISKDKLEKQINIFNDNKKVSIVNSLYEQIDQFGKLIELKKKPEVQESYTLYDFIKKNVMGAVFSPLIKREVVIDVGGFDENFHNYCADWEFWLKACFLRYKVIICPEVLGYYRRHEDSLTKKRIFPNSLGDLAVVLRAKELLGYDDCFVIEEISKKMFEVIKWCCIEEGRFKAIPYITKYFIFCDEYKLRKNTLDVIILLLSPKIYHAFSPKIRSIWRRLAR